MRNPTSLLRPASCLLPLALATALLAMAACSKSPAERAVEAAASAASGQDVDISRDADGISIKTGDGEDTLDISSGDRASLPEGFPDDVYLPAGFKVISSAKADATMLVGMVAPGTLDRIAEQANQAMLEQGWEQTRMAEDGPSVRILEYKKADRSARIALQGQPDGMVGLVLHLG